MLDARPGPRDESGGDARTPPPAPLQGPNGNAAAALRSLHGGASLRMVLGGAVALAAIALTAAGGLRVVDALLRQGVDALAAFAAMLGGIGVLGGLAFWRVFAARPRHPRWLSAASRSGAEGLS